MVTFRKQALFVLALYVTATMPPGVSFEDHAAAELRNLLLPWLNVAHSHIINPTISELKQIAQGPVCAFNPNSWLCEIMPTKKNSEM